MSTWTHVAAVFRIDSLREDIRGPRINGRHRPDWDRVTGRAIYDGDERLVNDSYEQRRYQRDWADYHEHPEQFMPTGSEGSLQRLVWENPDGHAAAQYVITVFGDLRDYSDLGAVRKWFEDVCKRCNVRQATCTCEVEGLNSHTWSQPRKGAEE